MSFVGAHPTPARTRFVFETMESPFKVRSLNFEDADNSSVQTDGEQQEAFYSGLMKIVWPNDAFAVPTKPSPIKTKTVPIWDKANVGIVNHLFDVKLHCELLLSLIHI